MSRNLVVRADQYISLPPETLLRELLHDWPADRDRLQLIELARRSAVSSPL